MMHLITFTVKTLGLLFGVMWPDRESRITQLFCFKALSYERMHGSLERVQTSLVRKKLR